jgi:hypothetical protein
VLTAAGVAASSWLTLCVKPVRGSKMERKVFGILKPPRMMGRRGTLPGSLLTRKPNRKPSVACRLRYTVSLLAKHPCMSTLPQRRAESWQAEMQEDLIIIVKLKWTRDSTLLVACGTGPVAQPFTEGSPWNSDYLSRHKLRRWLWRCAGVHA